jgi:hypothetical protein
VNDDSVSIREFTHAIQAFERQMADLKEDVGEVKDIAKETLVEGKKTNGRVNLLEVRAERHGENLKNLNNEVFRSGRKPVGVVTMRDVYIVLGTLTAVAAAAKWLPAMLTAGQVAP